MIKKTVMVVSVDKRRSQAPLAQKILTGYGCIIKTRLGIHDGVLDKCSDHGLLILELVGSEKEKRKMGQELKSLPGVTVKTVNI